MELVISMALLSGLVILLFSAFELGTRIFRDTSVRQSSENQLRNIKVLLERDINLTNFWYCNTVSRPTADGSRDALALSSMDDWRDASSYDTVTLRPLWNRYVVWYATNGPTGKLYRQLVAPSVPSGGFIAAYGDLSTNINSDPDTNSDVVYSRLLSEDVIDFATSTRFQNGTITATIRLQATGNARAATLEKTEDNLQVTFTFQPKNRWPPM